MSYQPEELEQNRKIKEGLCKEAEKLKVSTEWREAAERFKAMQQEWRQTGPVPYADAELLNQRFRAACDTFFENRKRNYQAQELERIDNLYRKTELCDKAEALKDSEDLQEATEALQRFFEEWKSIGPVPREKSDALWERFRAAQDAVYQRKRMLYDELDKSREENLKLKTALCIEAETLAEHNDFGEATPLIIALQEKWKSIGHVPREKSDEIWERFRNACDRFFSRRNEHLNMLDETRLENLAKREKIAEMAHQLKESAEWNETTEKIKELQAGWKSAWPVPRDECESLWEEFRQACDHFFERKRLHFEEKRKEWQKNQAVWRMNMQKVIIRKEEEIGRIEAAIVFEKNNLEEWQIRLEKLPPELKSVEMKMEIEDKIEKSKAELERKSAMIAQLMADIEEINLKLEKE